MSRHDEGRLLWQRIEIVLSQTRETIRTTREIVAQMRRDLLQEQGDMKPVLEESAEQLERTKRK